MTEQAESATQRLGDPAPDGSIRENVERLARSGRTLLDAELEWARLKAAMVAVGARDAAIFGVLAILFLFAGMTTLLVGAVLALVPLVGAVLAALIVGGVAVLIAGGCALGAKRAVGRMVGKDDAA